MSKVALITGITGQDGSYLAEFLLEKGYEVHGIVRRASISNTARIDHLIEKNVIKLHDGDLSDSSGLIRLVGRSDRMKFIIWLPRAMCKYPLMRRNIPVMWMHWVSCACWKLSVSAV